MLTISRVKQASLEQASVEQDRVGLMVHDIARLARARFDLRARTLGVTRQQWRVLFHLDRFPGRSQSELADVLEVERITLCRMIDRLEEAGLVERRADPDDRRIWRLHLLAWARPLVAQLAEIGREVEAELLVVLAPDERTQLIDMLVRVREGLRGMQPDRKAA